MKNHHKIYWYFLFTILSMVCICGGGLQSQNAIKYKDAAQVLSISSDLELFEDNGSILIVDSVIENQNTDFRKTIFNTPSYSFTEATVWCRFKLENLTDEDCYLEISPPFLNEVTLYQIFNNRIDSVCQGSLFINKNIKGLRSNSYVFKLDRNSNFCLLKIKTKTRLFIKAKIGTYQSILARTRNVDMVQSIYAGLIAMIFIYNLFLFYTSKENVFLFYLLHLINSAIFFLYMSGYGIEYLWNRWPIINSYFLTFICLGFILSMLFVINFLETRKNLPVIHKILSGIIVSLLTISAIDLSGFSHFAGRLMNYVGFIAIAFVLTGAVTLARRGFKPAHTFIYAWLFYLLGIAVQTLQSLNFIPTNEITANTIQIGSGIEIVLLSLAVANKINFYKERKLEAMNHEKELLMEKELLKITQKDNLEQLFQERTELLYNKNRELKKQNKEIKLKHEEISAQNRKFIEYHDLLEAKNKIITQQNADLKIHKENLEQLIEERTSELKEATIKAEHADQLKTAFLKDFSHEIRTPMNAISGFSSLLMDIETDDELNDYYKNIIINHTDYLLELIDNIVDLSRIQTNSLVLKKVKFDPEKMFTALLDKMTQKLKQEKKSFINLRLVLPEDKDLRLNLDYNRFWKIVHQLIDNSIKYTEAGYIEFGYRQVADSKDVEIFVIDTGIGIKKEKLAYVFDSFRKFEERDTKLLPGTGMGLSLVKGLVTLMNGEIKIDSVSTQETKTNNSGTTITVLLPNAIT